MSTLRDKAEEVLFEFFHKARDFSTGHLCRPGASAFGIHFTLDGITKEARFLLNEAMEPVAVACDGKITVLRETKLEFLTEAAVKETTLRLFGLLTASDAVVKLTGHETTTRLFRLLAGEIPEAVTVTSRDGRTRGEINFIDAAQVDHNFAAVFDDKGVLEYIANGADIFHAIYDEKTLDAAGYREFKMQGHEDSLRDIIRDRADLDDRNYRIEYFRDPDDEDDDESQEDSFEVTFDRWGSEVL